MQKIPPMTPLILISSIFNGRLKNLKERKALFMKNLILKFEPADVIAIVIILGSMALKFSGADGIVSVLLTSVAFYYFGKRGNPAFRKDV